VLYGLGGSGKTTIAREVAQRAKNEMEVWWLNGGSGNLERDSAQWATA
jgi:adenylylsulfate kinase-like enzyme